MGGEGVELPVSIIYEQSQVMNTSSKNGTSDNSNILGDKDLAPGDSVVDLLE